MKRGDDLQTLHDSGVSKRAQRRAERLAKREAKHGPQAKTTFRRNVLPVVAGTLVMLMVLAGMNAQLIYAQIKYRMDVSAPPAAAQTVASRPDTTDQAKNDTKDPNPELGPRIEIPTLAVKAPIQFAQGTAEWQIQKGLQNGVVHFDGAPMPGQVGNVVIFGHSSGALWAPGDYKFIFTTLDKLQIGDQIYVYREGVRYTYTMTDSQVVSPADIGVLKSSNTHELTLITCTPVGTSTNRLVINAEQTSPAPTTGEADATMAGGLRNLPGSAR